MDTPLFSSLLAAIAALRPAASSSTLAVLIAAFVLWTGCKAGTKNMILSLIGAAAIVLLTKYVFWGCGVKMTPFYIGHPLMDAALATFLLTGFAALLASQLDGFSRYAPWALLLGLATGLATAQILLDHADPAWVGGGFALGLGLGLGLDRLAIRPHAPRLDLRLLVVLGILAVVVFHSQWNETRALLDQTARWIKTC